MATAPLPLRLDLGGYEDLDTVMAIMNAAFDPHYGEAWTRSQCGGILPMNGVRLIIARDGKMAIGFSLYRMISDEAELLLLAVDPSAQRRGVGRQLLDEFMHSCLGGGSKRLHLEVRDGNSATRFYERAGFQVAGRRRRYYCGDEGERLDALTYVKNL